MTMETDDLVMLFKLITGELVIGILDKEMFEENSDIFFIKDPLAIVLTSRSFYLTRYNKFSKLGTIMLPNKSVVYVDLPSDILVKLYQEALNPKVPQTTVDEEGILHPLH